MEDFERICEHVGNVINVMNEKMINATMDKHQVEDFERICERVGNVRDEAVAQGARIVHRTKQVIPSHRHFSS